MKLLAVLLALALAGCAHERVVIETVELKVPVMVPCPAKVPADFARPTKTDAKDIFEAMKLALAEIELWEAWGVKAKAAIEGCTGGKQP